MLPPACASSVHSKMLASLQNLLHRQGLRLEQDMGDICLLTVVHSTRIEADITRDSRCLKGEKRNFQILYFLSIFGSLFIPGIGYQRLIMVILIPMREVPQTFFSQVPPSIIPRCDLVLEMFVNTNLTVFFDCDHNSSQLNRIVKYIFS